MATSTDTSTRGQRLARLAWRLTGPAILAFSVVYALVVTR